MRTLSPPPEPHTLSVEVVSKHPLPPRIHTQYCPGHEAGGGYPDFLISKIYTDGNGGYTRKILSLIEVKRDGSTSEDATMQLVRYIELAGDQSRDERRVHSYLVLGHKFVAFGHTESLSYAIAPPDEHPILYAPGSNSLVEDAPEWLACLVSCHVCVYIFICLSYHIRV